MKKRIFRGRRLRATGTLRDLVRETLVTENDLMMPYFAADGDPGMVKPVSAMPGVSQLGLDALVEEVGRGVDMGLKSVILFGIPATKDETGSSGYDPEGIVPRAIRAVKSAYPDLVVAADVCLCEYTSHGHCGLIKDGKVLNDPTLELLARCALAYAEAGADVVAPSDMMDGRVKAIRRALDKEGFQDTPVMSYAVKYASAFYGPFREAAESTPAFGDRKTYQMDPANVREAMLEARADHMEGADMLMVKPAGPYLDVIKAVRDRFNKPVAAYQVSGEYSMIKAAGQLGWIDEDRVMLESLTGIKRAGADLILTYFAVKALELLNG